MAQAPAAIQGPQNTLQKKKQNEKTVHNIYAGIGVGYVTEPSHYGPYKHGVSGRLTGGFPILQDKVIIDLNIISDFMYAANNGWYASAYNLNMGLPANASMGHYTMGTVGIMPVIFNGKNGCLAAGAFYGINYIELGIPGKEPYINYVSSPTRVSRPAYGIKIHYYADKNYFLFAQLNLAVVNDIPVDTQSGTYQRIANFNTLEGGVAYRFNF